MSITAKSAIRRDAVSPYHQNDGLSGVPVTRRRSLPADQRQRPMKPSIEADALEGGPSRTDALREEPVTRPPLQDTNVRRLQRSRCSVVQKTTESKRLRWGMIVLLFILVALASWGFAWGCLSMISWFTDIRNTFDYGPTRTSVVSGVFGIAHDSPANPTSVIAINVHGTLVVESIPANDVSMIKSYPTGFAMVGDTVGKLPIHLTMVHLTRKKIKDTRLDVQIEIPGQGITLYLINTGTGFVLTKPE